MDADECQSGLNLASQGALAKLAVRQLGRLIGIYMLPSSDQLFITRGCCWNGLFTYNVCIRTQWKATVCMMDACTCMCVYAHVKASVFPIISQ